MNVAQAVSLRSQTNSLRYAQLGVNRPSLVSRTTERESSSHLPKGPNSLLQLLPWAEEFAKEC
jgi:hypothetical protein